MTERNPNPRRGVILSPVASDGLAWIAAFPLARAIDGDVAKGTTPEPTATIAAYCYVPGKEDLFCQVLDIPLPIEVIEECERRWKEIQEAAKQSPLIRKMLEDMRKTFNPYRVR